MAKLIPAADPPRPTHPPPAGSWWAQPRVQQDRRAFDAEVAKQEPRMNAVPVYAKPQGKEE